MVEEEEGTRHSGSKSCLRRLVIILAAVACLYSLYMTWVLRYPAVRGVVVDQDTGQAIPGAEIYKAAEGYAFPQESDQLRMGGEGHAVLSEKGTFSFWGGLALRWGLWPLQNVDRVALWVYAKDYVPMKFSEMDDVTTESLKGGI